MITDPNSSPLAFFAAELKRLRGMAEMTQEQLADATTYSPALVAAIETCRRIPSDDFAERADKALRTDGILARLQTLVEQTSVLPWFRDLVEVERRATDIRAYETYVIPGLLQTEDYARHCISATRPVITAEDVDRAVALRMTRQEILSRDDDPPRLWAIIDENVLYLEDIRSARYLRKPEDVSQYGLTFDHLRSSALSDVKSATLIGEVITRYER